MNNTIPLHRTTHGSYEIVVLEPKPDSSNSMTQAVQALRQNKAVILKLQTLDKSQAQRILDFISGSAYAICGHPSKIGSAVFLFTPYTIQIQSSRSG